MSPRPTATFFFNDTATTEIYTLSLHDALPISRGATSRRDPQSPGARAPVTKPKVRSEEHTSELQSQSNLVCRLLLEKKKRRNLAGLDTPCPRSAGKMTGDRLPTHRLWT